MRSILLSPSGGGTADFNHEVYEIPWEEGVEFSPGPVGEYLEVIDVDPTSGQTYIPVDLDDPYILANVGLEPTRRSAISLKEDFPLKIALKRVRRNPSAENLRER